MAQILTAGDIEEKIKKVLTVQDYSGKKLPEGIKLVELKNFVGEDGDFSELFRLNADSKSEHFPNFKIAQINRSNLAAGCIKAWHLHFRQDEIWYVSPHFKLTVGLFDVRKNSPTAKLAVKLILGGGKSQLLYIPRGVAHGCANFSKKDIDLFYFVSNIFNLADPDEQRLPWNICGNTFWEPEKS